MSDNTGNRKIWLDNIRGFAIILVVLSHTGIGNDHFIISTITNIISSFHMHLLFMISGITFSLLKIQDTKTVLKRSANIFSIYLIQNFIYIITRLVVQSSMPMGVTISSNLLLSYIIKPVFHFWYIYVLAVLYLIDLVLNRLIKRVDVKLLICLVVCVYSYFLIDNETIFRILFYLLFFEVGRYCEFIIDRISIVFCTISLLVCFGVQIFNIDIYYIKIIISLSISLSLVKLFKQFLNNKYILLTYIGENSMFIYIFHIYFIYVARFLCNRYIGILGLSYLLTVVVGILGPLLLYFILRKAGLDQYVRKPIFLRKKSE